MGRDAGAGEVFDEGLEVDSSAPSHDARESRHQGFAFESFDAQYPTERARPFGIERVGLDLDPKNPGLLGPLPLRLVAVRSRLFFWGSRASCRTERTYGGGVPASRPADPDPLGECAGRRGFLQSAPG